MLSVIVQIMQLHEFAIKFDRTKFLNIKFYDNEYQMKIFDC